MVEINGNDVEHYSVLGIDSFSSLENVKKAYRRLALELHPDKIQSQQKDTGADFIRVADSYHFLMRNKTLYDVILSQASAGTLAGKVNVVPEDELDVDEEGVVTFECK